MSQNLYIISKVANLSDEATCMGIALPNPHDLTQPMDITSIQEGWQQGNRINSYQWVYAPHLNSNLDIKFNDDYIKEISNQISCFQVKGEISLLNPPCLLLPNPNYSYAQAVVEVEVVIDTMFHTAGYQSRLWFLMLANNLYGNLFQSVSNEEVLRSQKLSFSQNDIVPFVTFDPHISGVAKLIIQKKPSYFVANIVAVGSSINFSEGMKLYTYFCGTYDKISFSLKIPFCTILHVKCN